jgi:hypothetical protein
MKYSINNNLLASTLTYYYNIAITEISAIFKVLARDLAQKTGSYETHDFTAYE